MHEEFRFTVEDGRQLHLRLPPDVALTGVRHPDGRAELWFPAPFAHVVIRLDPQRVTVAECEGIEAAAIGLGGTIDGLI